MPVVTLSGTASQLVAKNNYRKSIVIQNLDVAINVFLKFEDAQNGTTVTSSDFDFRLGVGDTLSLNRLLDGEDRIPQRITAIAASGTPSVAFFETEDIDR